MHKSTLCVCAQPHLHIVHVCAPSPPHCAHVHVLASTLCICASSPAHCVCVRALTSTLCACANPRLHIVDVCKSSIPHREWVRVMTGPRLIQQAFGEKNEQHSCSTCLHEPACPPARARNGTESERWVKLDQTRPRGHCCCGQANKATRSRVEVGGCAVVITLFCERLGLCHLLGWLSTINMRQPHWKSCPTSLIIPQKYPRRMASLASPPPARGQGQRGRIMQSARAKCRRRILSPCAPNEAAAIPNVKSVESRTS